MDQIKIGKFIAEMRKEQNLTQIDLAEELGISNKTISKWECGNGMPDYAVMEDLCKILKINVNELLSGERLPSHEYNKKAEENMMSLMQESSEIYKREKKEMVLMMLGVILLLIVVGYMIFMYGGVSAIHNFIDAPIMLGIFLTVGAVLFTAGQLKDFGKGIINAFKKSDRFSIVQKENSLQAIKTAIGAVNVAGVLSFVVGVIESLRMWANCENLLDRIDSFILCIAVALLGIVYGFVTTLILIPIYMRLKGKLVEE